MEGPTGRKDGLGEQIGIEGLDGWDCHLQASELLWVVSRLRRPSLKKEEYAVRATSLRDETPSGCSNRLSQYAFSATVPGGYCPYRWLSRISMDSWFTVDSNLRAKNVGRVSCCHKRKQGLRWCQYLWSSKKRQFAKKSTGSHSLIKLCPLYTLFKCTVSERGPTMIVSILCGFWLTISAGIT